MKKLIMITTVPLSFATLIKGQPKYLSQFFHVKLVTSYSIKNTDIEQYEGVQIKSIEMTRSITPFKDLKALWQLFYYLVQEKPDIVYTFTPKAGLLGMMASFFARVPVRVHNIVGMPLMEATGNKQRMLKYIEKMTYLFATRLLCNSFGLKQYIESYLTSREVKVIAQGSINGVDATYFCNMYDTDNQEKIRKKYHISATDFVLIYVGRIVKDKGIDELIEAFQRLKSKYVRLKLLLVGDYEPNLNPVRNESLDYIEHSDDVITVGFQDDIRKFLAISNVFVLPSYREGLPNALIEAGCYGIPLIATDINGCNEVIVEEETGLLVKKKDVKSLIWAIERLMLDTALYNHIKSNVRNVMISRYEQTYVWTELKNELLR